jgi:hypothetical protein
MRLTFLSLLLTCAGLAGCTTAPRTTMLGPARTAITTAEAVRVYERAPRGAQEIALVEGKTIGELRSKAAAVGANGIVPGGVVRNAGPTLGIGIGTGSYQYGRRSAVGVSTGAAFDVPPCGWFFDGLAFYVRR